MGSTLPAGPADIGEAAEGADLPGSLADPSAVARRQALLQLPHARPLAEYVQRLGVQGRGFVPDFDPLDGGVEARLLMLLEKPGPRICPPRGSGFVSRDNADQTARTLHRFMREADVPRRGVVVWNIVPWWNGTITLVGAEKRLGGAELRGLLTLLPSLRGVILAGNPAWEFGAPPLAASGLELFRCVHPSPQARIGPRTREAWLLLPQIWQKAWKAVA